MRLTVLRDSLAVVSAQTVEDGEITFELRTYFGRKPESGFAGLFSSTRSAVYHVLNGGEQVALVQMNVPKTIPFRFDLPSGWEWFYSDKNLANSVDRWYQVPPGEADVELWADNRDPSTLPPPPAVEEGPAEEREPQEREPEERVRLDENGEPIRP